MTWDHLVNQADVTPAFEAILEILEESEGQVYVVVDILNSPHFPMAETMARALLGPFRHPRLEAWLIIGNNWMARSIEELLVKVTGRSNVFWFSSEVEALAHLRNQVRQTAAA
jgi:hypothetical protein